MIPAIFSLNWRYPSIDTAPGLKSGMDSDTLLWFYYKYLLVVSLKRVDSGVRCFTLLQKDLIIFMDANFFYVFMNLFGCILCSIMCDLMSL